MSKPTRLLVLALLLLPLFLLGCGLTEAHESQDLPSRVFNQPSPSGESEHVEGEVVVKFREDPVLKPANLVERVFLKKPKIKANTSSLNQVSKELGIETADKLVEEAQPLYKLKVGAGESVERAVAELEKDPLVEKAEPNYIYRVSVGTPNDEHFDFQWGLVASHFPEAWEITQGSSEVIVAVTDTGVDLNHADLVANLWVNSAEVSGNGVDDDGNDYIDDVQGVNIISPSSAPDDDNGHGTHVAGIIGAVTNNDLGVAGACWQCRLMVVKWLDGDGTGTLENAIKAVNYAVDNGASIINASWGGPAESGLLAQAVQRALNHGVVFVGAIGNAGVDEIFYPAAVEGVIAVGAADSADQRAAFSNYGGELGLLAPGVEIASTFVDGQYVYMSGTSMAAPFVSGAAALLRAAGLVDAVEIKQRLLDTADDLGPPGWDQETGFGKLNAWAALSEQPPPPPEPETDLQTVIQYYGSNNQEADVSEDNIVNGFDFSLVRRVE